MIIEIDPVLDPRWDQFVESHPFGLICHLSGWKQVLEESFPHMKGHYLAILNHDNNSILAALPVFEVRSILTGNRLVSITFATNCDPLISSKENFRELLESVINLSTKLKCPKIEIRALASLHLVQDDRLGIVVHDNSHQLSLETTPAELMKTFDGKARSRIKKSLKNGLDLQIARSEEDLLEFYKLHVKARKRLGLPPQPYLFFELLWRKFYPTNHITLLLVSHKGQLVSGLLMFKFKNRCSQEYLASDERFNHLYINYFCMFEAIKLAQSEGYKIYDLGRTEIKNEGLMSYKNHWGGKVVDLPKFYYPKKLCSSLVPRETSVFYKLIRNISKHVPDSLFVSIGNFMYRHLG